MGHLFTVARDLAKKEGIAESGYRLIMNCNKISGMEVPHLHLHLIGGRWLGPMVRLKTEWQPKKEVASTAGRCS